MDFKSKLITSSVTLSNSESIPRLKGKCDRIIKLPVLRLWKKHVLISLRVFLDDFYCKLNPTICTILYFCSCLKIQLLDLS